MFRIGDQLINENNITISGRVDNAFEIKMLDGELIRLVGDEAKAAWHYLTVDVPDQLEWVKLEASSKARVENGHAKLVEKYGEPMF